MTLPPLTPTVLCVTIQYPPLDHPDDNYISQHDPYYDPIPVALPPPNITTTLGSPHTPQSLVSTVNYIAFMGVTSTSSTTEDPPQISLVPAGITFGNMDSFPVPAVVLSPFGVRTRLNIPSLYTHCVIIFL